MRQTIHSVAASSARVMRLVSIVAKITGLGSLAVRKPERAETMSGFVSVSVMPTKFSFGIEGKTGKLPLTGINSPGELSASL